VITCLSVFCGHCEFCLSGRPSICQDPEVKPPPGTAKKLSWKGGHMNQFLNLSSFAEQMVVHEHALVKVREDMPLDLAALIGCGVMTGYGSAVNVAKVTPGSSTDVLGAGGVGLNAIQGCRVSGADKIIAIDVNPQRLEFAKRFGATHTILADRHDTGLLNAAKEVKTLCGGRGADFAFECTAVPALGAAPLAMVRNAGTACQVSGIEQEITIDMRPFAWDKIYINPLYGGCDPYDDIPKSMNLYDKGALLLDEMITRTYRLEDLEQAFHDRHTGKNAKGVVVFD